MCLAIPGKVKSIDGQVAIVEYPKEERKVMVGGTDVNVGDFVMVQMGIIIKVLSPEQAEVSLDAWNSVGK